MIYLSLPHILKIAERVLEQELLVRDLGIIEAAAARPRATAFGQDVYRTLEEKAAAILHSIVNGHPLVDGNKRLGLGAVIAILGLNGRRLALSEDEAYELVMDVARGAIDDVEAIAARIRSEPRGPRDH